MSNKHLLEFGAFTLNLEEERIFSDNTVLSLTPKSFQLLKVLTENPGKILDKEVLMSKVWQDSFVEEGNLTFNIRQLRKLLKDDSHNPKYIETIPRRGYRFIADVREPREPADDSLPGCGETPGEEPAAVPKNGFTILAGIMLSSLIVLVSGLTVCNFYPSGRSKNLEFRLLTENGASRQAAISPDGKFMAFVNRTNEKESLWLRNLDSNTNIQILEPSDKKYYCLRFSIENDIYFVREDADNFSSLYKTSLLGGAPTRIISGLAPIFSIAADGGKIGFIRDDPSGLKSRLMTANLDGGDENEVAVSDLPNRFMALAWINNGKEIAYAIGESDSAKQNIEVRKLNLENRASEKIGSDQWFQVKSILWIESRKNLLLLGRKKLSEQNQLWQIKLSNDNFEKILPDTNYYTDITSTVGGEKILALQSKNNFSLYLAEIAHPEKARQLVKSYRGVSWAKDGRLFYASNINDNDDIWSIAPDGSDNKQLTFNRATDYLPRVMPDGSVIYVSDQAGINHIMKMNFDGSEPIKLTGEGGGTCPAVSADGRLIVYNSLDKNVLQKMNADGTGKQTLTRLKGKYPAISFDNSMTAFFQSPESGEPSLKISVVESATGEMLKSFDLNGKHISAWRILWKPDDSGFYYATYSTGSTSVLWFQPYKEASAEKIAEFQNQQLFDFDISPDGKTIALIRGNWEKDAVLINGFD